MSVVEALERMGGLGTRRALVAATSRVDFERAVDVGDVVRLARNRYALATVDEARRAAHRLTGVISHRSAALEHGWEVKTAPKTAEITLPKNRKVLPGQDAGVHVHRSNLPDDDIDGVVTTKERTLVDCLRNLPFDEALTIADSALRHGFSAQRLGVLAFAARGPGSDQVRRVARAASADSSGPFESVLRAIALTVLGLSVVPQVSIREQFFLGRPDLVDERLRIILEADSMEWHGNRAAMERDAKRYNQFSVRGWMVLRFVWEQVMFHEEEVAEVLSAAVRERTDQRCVACRAA